MLSSIKISLICVGFWLNMASSVNLDIDLINQYPNYPTGCESVATVETLNYLGFNITVDEFIDKYLPKTMTPYEGVFFDYFYGDPRSYYGSLCYPEVITKSVDAYFSDINCKSCRVYNYSNKSFKFLLNELSLGHPIIIWSTIDCQEPTLKQTSWGSYLVPNHTVVLKGFDLDKNEVYIVDSIAGVVTRNLSEFESIYNKMGKRSVVIK